MVNVPPHNAANATTMSSISRRLSRSRLPSLGATAKSPFTLSYIESGALSLRDYRTHYRSSQNTLVSPSSGESDLMIILLVEATYTFSLRNLG